MRLGNRDHERFWIALTVRVAFGFLFLIAAINIVFSDWNDNVGKLDNAKNGVENFVTKISKPYETSWVNVKIGGTEIGIVFVKFFLSAMPFIFLTLSFFLLTGLLLRPALRASALFLVLFGLGKYVTDFSSGNTITTLQDFMYAMFITLALFVLSKEPEARDGPPDR